MLFMFILYACEDCVGGFWIFIQGDVRYVAEPATIQDK
jgi:hypothetical protein